MTKKAVRQNDLMGCGVACVAYVLKISYADALKLFKNGKRRAQREGFFCKEIIAVFATVGLDYRLKYIKKKTGKKVYKPGTIVFVKKPGKYFTGHYLCRSDKGWMDSWINIPEIKIRAGFRKRLPGLAHYAIVREN